MKNLLLLLAITFQYPNAFGSFTTAKAELQKAREVLDPYTRALNKDASGGELSGDEADEEEREPGILDKIKDAANDLLDMGGVDLDLEMIVDMACSDYPELKCEGLLGDSLFDATSWFDVVQAANQARSTKKLSEQLDEALSGSGDQDAYKAVSTVHKIYADLKKLRDKNAQDPSKKQDFEDQNELLESFDQSQIIKTLTPEKTKKDMAIVRQLLRQAQKELKAE